MKTTRTLTLFLALAPLGLLFPALSTPTAHANPDVLRVKVNGAASGACGDSWDNPCGLQHALKDRATLGTLLWVAAGTYVPTTDGNRNATFLLRDGIAVLGGFAGTETAVDQRNPVGNVTILSGDLNGNDNSNMAWNEPTRGDNSFHVVTGSGVANGAMLDGFTVKGGHANNSTSPNDRGGGMYNNGGSPTLAAVTFSGNWGYGGGGMNNYNSNPTLTNVTFSGNTVDWDGGGLQNDYSSPTLANVTFSGNSATFGDGGGMQNRGSSSPTLTNVSFISNTAESGGGMYNNTNGTTTLTNVTFISNTASIYGGAMYNSTNSNPTLTNATFSSNSASWGGGMYNASASPTLMNVSFSGNSATYGGGMYNDLSSPILTNVTFISNTVSMYGGAMRNDSGSPTLTNATFKGNTATYGGGMYNIQSNLMVTNATFSGNSATGGGGAIANLDSSNPTIRNSILWGNTPSNPQIHNEGASAPSLFDSVVQGGYVGGTHIIIADPRLGVLGNYGGSTQTIPLLYGSSAIDAGNNATCPDFDQRGIPRPQGAGCDIGAYESIWMHLPLIRK